jgi:predicted peptidase
MKQTARQALVLSIALISLGSSVYAQNESDVDSRFLNKTIDVHGAEQRYVVYVPEGYTAETAWPLIVFLHGAGERGDDGLAQTKAGLGPAIKKMPSRFPAIVLMPQCPREQVWNTRHDGLDAQLAKTLADYNIDESRIYLTGLSMGGYGAWLWGAIHTDSVAAIMPICGGGAPTAIQNLLGVGGGNPYGSHASRLRALATVPIWAFHGGADGVVPPEESRNMVKEIKARGGNIRYTEYEGVGHNSWDRAYQESEGIEWLLKQKKR